MLIGILLNGNGLFRLLNGVGNAEIGFVMNGFAKGLAYGNPE